MEIGAENVLLYHALCIKERPIDRDRMAHQFDELIPMIVKEREDHFVQFLIEGNSVFH